MTEMKFICQRDQTELRATCEEDMAKCIQKHVHEVHKKDMSEKDARFLAGTAKRV